MIGAKLKQARLDAGFSQHNVERLTGIKTEVISRWEAGVNTPRFETMCRLARLYGKPLDFFCPDEVAA